MATRVSSFCRCISKTRVAATWLIEKEECVTKPLGKAREKEGGEIVERGMSVANLLGKRKLARTNFLKL